jgi:hypothetical protein
MAAIEEDKFRERRIDMEILVDVYEEEEIAPSWYAYLENNLSFPFVARCVIKWEPFRPGDELVVSGMALEKECDEEIFVATEHVREPMIIPLTHVETTGTDEGTREAVEDWRYWVRRGYELPRHEEE